MDTQSEDGRRLVLELAEAVLARTAPEEIALLQDTSEEYFADPAAVLNPARRDESVGFGVELALLTPVVLAVVTPVIQFLLTIAADALKAEFGPTLVARVRRVIRRPRDATSLNRSGPTPALTTEQVRKVREIAYERARAVGVEESQANLLADAVAGGVVAQ